MASVHKSKKSRFWHGSVWIDGRQVFRSTGETDKSRALAVAMAWEAAAKGPKIEGVGQARKVLEDLLRRVHGSDVRTSVPVREYVGGWLRDQAGAVADSTLAFYRGALQGWLEWLGPRAEQGIDLIGREDVVAWRETEISRVRAKTVSQRIKALRAVMRAALRDGMIAADPTDGVRSPKAPARERKVRRPFTREEIERVLGLADGDWRLMIQLGLQTGQRLGDLVRMDWRDLDLQKGIWTLTAGKTGRRVLVPLGEGVLAELQARGPRPAGDVFPPLVARLGGAGQVGLLSNDFAAVLWRAGLRRYSPHDRVAKGGRKAELVDAGSDRREQQELSFHSLRHTARSWLEEAGQPKAVIDAYVGHSGDMGRQYTTVGMEALRAAAAVLGAAIAAPAAGPETQNPQR